MIVRCLGRPGPARIGLIVSRSSGNAVTRNRIKRRLRHTLREQPLEPGNDYVIIASKQVAEVPFPTLQRWLLTALESSQGA